MTSDETNPTTSDEEASPTGELGRHMHKGTLNVMWGGVWVPLGDAEFLTENGRIVKVISYTPREFTDAERGEQTS
jgi:hypothetical protein